MNSASGQGDGSQKKQSREHTPEAELECLPPVKPLTAYLRGEYAAPEKDGQRV